MTKENIPEFTVTTLSQSIRNTLETEFEYVRVKGELGRVSRPASGHVYFDLKDDKSILASVVWRGTKLTKRDLIEEGNEVVLVGRISSFSGHSKYQIIVEDIQAAGIGALLAMLNKRREKLAAEGIFSEKRKLALPTYPLSIGVITSISGAVIKDILNRVEARFPVKVIIFPVTVQGDSCAKDVIEGINVGIGTFTSRSQEKTPICMTNRSSDLRKSKIQNSSNLMNTTATAPYVIVVKKNAATLKNLNLKLD